MPAVELPVTMLVEIDALVAAGAYASREAAVADLLRLGLDVLRERTRGPRPPMPTRPPVPPGVGDPHADDPISVDPRDTKWM